MLCHTSLFIVFSVSDVTFYKKLTASHHFLYVIYFDVHYNYIL